MIRLKRGVFSITLEKRHGVSQITWYRNDIFMRRKSYYEYTIQELLDYYIEEGWSKVNG